MILERGREVLAVEAEALQRLKDGIGPEFVRVVEAILACPGRVIVTGMGKSGHIGRKIAATFASTGTPAFFLHPGEGIHGDLGMVTGQDLVLALSNSGESPEVLAIVPTIKLLGCTLVAVVGRPGSELASRSDHTLVIPVEKEADPLGLAPTASTTAMLALGDALAIAAAEERHFGPDDFALFHPGGALGRRLLHTVSRLMHAGEGNPVVAEGVTLREAIAEMTAKGLGATSIVDAAGELVGILTDGDLRRFLARRADALDRPVGEAMTRNPSVIQPDSLAAEALRLMERTARGVTVLPVVVAGKPVGMIHMHDILRALTSMA